MLEEPRNELIDQPETMSRELAERSVDRRRFLAGIGAGAAVAVGARAALAQDMGPAEPPSTVTTPPRDFGPDAPPNVYFWDPDVIAVDPSFNGLAQPNAPIQRLWTGALWAEGPAWNSVGKFLVWSDIPNNRQMRWIEDDGHVSVFRMPSNNSNGNTFDFQGRQISCEHSGRRVVRYELDGSVSVIADSFEGKRLNSPNDAVPASRRQRLVHRPAVRQPDLRRRSGRERRPDQPAGPAQSAPRSGRRHRHRVEAPAADPELPSGPRRLAQGGRHRGPGAGPERSVLLARLQAAVHREHGQGAGRHRTGRQGQHLRLRRQGRRHDCRTTGCSPTAWSMA